MATIKYQAHCTDIGWQDPVEDGRIAGTIGEHRALEAFRIDEVNIDGVGVQAFALVKDLGWSAGNIQTEDVGSTGLGKPLQAVRMGLFGENADKYEIFYRLHVENHGFLNWSKNGELNGTTGSSLQAEAIQIEIHAKDEHWYPYTDRQETFIDLTPAPEIPQQRDLRAELIAQAQSYLGYVSGTNNDSVFGRRYAGVNAGSWCCYFVRNCCDNVGIPFPKTGYCPDVVSWAKANGRWTQTPQAGDAVLYDFNGNGTSDHIGIVERVLGAKNIYAIEGNTGSPVGVYRKHRTSGIFGYVRLT